MPCRIAYLLERYPAFTQTFIVREVEEMRRQGVDLWVISLRTSDVEGEGHFSKTATDHVLTAPESDLLVAEIKRRRAAGELPKKINKRLEAWGSEPDKLRLYEAIWAGDLLQKRGIRHVHVHFAGLAARTACLMKELYGISFSFTGHAQDIYCKTTHSIDLGRLVREATAVVTEADFSAHYLQHTYPALGWKVKRVYNGMTLPQPTAATNMAMKLVPPLIVSVGRLIPKKGFPDLIAACAVLVQKGNAFRCQIAGDGPLEDELRALVEKQKTNVELVGAKSQTEIAAMLEQARVFALASVVMPDGDSDNFPTVITEAMAHRLPVVSTRVAGIPEQVIDGQTGFVVSPGDVVAFADKLETLLTNPEMAQRFGEAGFARAQSEFALHSTVAQLRKILPLKPWWKLF